MYLLTWFSLLWPLATIFCHLGILNSFIPHWGFYKSQVTVIFSSTLPNNHCKPVFHIIPIRFLADPGYISTADLILGSPQSLLLVQGMI